MDIQLLVATAAGQGPNATAKLPASNPGAFAGNLAQAARQASGGEAGTLAPTAGKAALTAGDDTAGPPQRGSLGVMMRALGDAPDGNGAASEAASARLAAIAQRLALIEGVGRPGEGTAKAGAVLPDIASLGALDANALQALAEAANTGDTPDTASLSELADMQAALKQDASPERADAAVDAADAGALGWMARVEALNAAREAGQGQKAERGLTMGGTSMGGAVMDGAALDRLRPDAERAALDALRHATQQRNAAAEPLPAALATRPDDIARAVEPGGALRAGPGGERWVGSGVGGERGESVAALNAQPASGAAGPPAASATLTAPVNSPAWPQQLGQQLVMLGQRGGEQRVELHLHPAELGPLSISLKVSDQSAQLQFLSANAQVRGAVEQAIPQLREALAEQGISLGDTSVGEQRQGQDSQFAGSTGRQGSGGSGEGGEAIADAPTSGSPAAADITLEGRVDLYA